MKIILTLVALLSSLSAPALDVGFAGFQHYLKTVIERDDSRTFFLCPTRGREEECFRLSSCSYSRAELERVAGGTLRAELDRIFSSSYQSETAPRGYLSALFTAMTALNTNKRCVVVTGIAFPPPPGQSE